MFICSVDKRTKMKHTRVIHLHWASPYIYQVPVNDNQKDHATKLSRMITLFCLYNAVII